MMYIFAGVCVNGKEYEDAEIIDLLDTTIGEYTENPKAPNGWSYLGDQFFEESNICIEYNDKNHVFEGTTALPDALKFITENGLSK